MRSVTLAAAVGATHCLSAIRNSRIASWGHVECSGPNDGLRATDHSLIFGNTHENTGTVSEYVVDALAGSWVVFKEIKGNVAGKAFIRSQEWAMVLVYWTGASNDMTDSGQWGFEVEDSGRIYMKTGGDFGTCSEMCVSAIGAGHIFAREIECRLTGAGKDTYMRVLDLARAKIHKLTISPGSSTVTQACVYMTGAGDLFIWELVGCPSGASAGNCLQSHQGSRLWVSNTAGSCPGWGGSCLTAQMGGNIMAIGGPDYLGNQGNSGCSPGI